MPSLTTTMLKPVESSKCPQTKLRFQFFTSTELYLIAIHPFTQTKHLLNAPLLLFQPPSPSGLNSSPLITLSLSSRGSSSSLSTFFSSSSEPRVRFLLYTRVATPPLRGPLLQLFFFLQALGCYGSAPENLALMNDPTGLTAKPGDLWPTGPFQFLFSDPAFLPWVGKFKVGRLVLIWFLGWRIFRETPKKGSKTKG